MAGVSKDGRLAFLTHIIAVNYQDYGLIVKGQTLDVIAALVGGSVISAVNAIVCDGAARLWAQLGKLEEDGEGEGEIRRVIKRLV